MSEFHDPELRQQLAHLSGPYPDENAAFSAWQRRVGQARRRRAMAWTTGAAMSLLVGVVAVAATQGQNKHSVVPEKASETTVGISTTVATTVPSTMTKMIVTESTDESTTSTSSTTLAPDTTPSSEDVVVTTPQPENSDAGGVAPVVTTHKPKPGSGGGAPTTPTTATTPTTDNNNDSHSANKTVASIGGTVTVHQFRDRLVIADVTPADGFDNHDSGHSGHAIQVTFTSATHRSEISVWIDNGTIKSFVNEKNETHGQSSPGDTSGDGYHGD